jgi:hypothetical protein
MIKRQHYTRHKSSRSDRRLSPGNCLAGGGRHRRQHKGAGRQHKGANGREKRRHSAPLPEATTARRQRPSASSRWARWVAAREEEQAVSSAMAGPAAEGSRAVVN